MSRCGADARYYRYANGCRCPDCRYEWKLYTAERKARLTGSAPPVESRLVKAERPTTWNEPEKERRARRPKLADHPLLQREPSRARPRRRHTARVAA
jgi:hypothetical protein